MSIGITQLILLIVVAIILFGNIPKLFKDLSVGIVTVKQSLSQSKSNKLDSTEVDNTKVTLRGKVDNDVPSVEGETKSKETSRSDYTNTNSKT